MHSLSTYLSVESKMQWVKVQGCSGEDDSMRITGYSLLNV